MTVTQIGRARYPLRPTPDPLKGTLLDAADVTDNADLKWLASADHLTEELWDSYNCMKFQHAAQRCQQTSKTFDNAAVWQSGFYFAVYGGHNCKAIGLDQAEMQSETERVFNAGESTAVEQAFMVQRFAAGPDRDPGAGTDRAWAAPTDITPAGGAVKPLLGVGMLEAKAASVYVGRPTLHLPRSIVTLLWGLGALEWDGDTLRTKMGSKVAAGAGYDYPNLGPTGGAATAGEKWIYASGEVQVLKGPAMVRQIMATTNNEVFILAERPYIGVADCFTAAVRVQESA